MAEVYHKFVAQRIVRRKQVLDYLAGDVEKTNAALRWLIKSGKAQRIKTGLFYFKQPNEWYENEITVSPWLIASNAKKGSVIGYHSALKLLGYAYSEVNELQIVVGLYYNRAPNSFSYHKIKYKYFRSDLSFGITEHITSDRKIKILDKERLVLEGLIQPDKFYGISEFLKSIENIKWLDLDHLLEMKAKYPLPTVSMRLGWLLQKYREEWYVEDSHLNQLKANRPEDRVFLVNRIRKGNVLDKMWNLMVPNNLLHLDE
jgi:predicted transcriptional regulator of viral defense system